MIAVAAGVKVLVATKPVDFRKGADGLVALVREALGHDPISVDALGVRTGLAAQVLSAKLLELELAGQVAQLPGGLVQRITR